MTRDYIESACVSHYHVIATIEIRKRSVELVDAYLRDLVGCRRKDGLFFCRSAANHCPLILWLSAAPPASYGNRGNGAINALFEDREGNVWVGGARGLGRIRDTVFVT